MCPSSNSITHFGKNQVTLEKARLCSARLNHLVMSDSLWPYGLMACRLPGSSVHGDSPGKNTGVGCHVLLQGFFLIQVWNPSLLHCRQILHCLRHQGSLRHYPWEFGTGPKLLFLPLSPCTLVEMGTSVLSFKLLNS